MASKDCVSNLDVKSAHLQASVRVCRLSGPDEDVVGSPVPNLGIDIIVITQDLFPHKNSKATLH